MKQDNYKVQDNKIIFKDGSHIDFEYEIRKGILFSSTIIVILEIPQGIIYNRNVFAVTIDGDFLWRVPETNMFYKGYNGNGCPYTNAIHNDKGQLVLFNWCDAAVVVDISTGDIIDKYITR